ncbi:MAG: protein kinase [Verrucomicrobiae bacterium]|nr:protein kinase [Verrucomicrobiae bacterium]
MNVEVHIFEDGKLLSTHLLSPGEYLVGREPTCHLNIPSTQVSRRHAFLTVTSDNLIVEDLGSANGTYVNEQEAHAPVAFSYEKRLRMGTVTLEFKPSLDSGLFTQTIETKPVIPDDKYDTLGVVAEGGMGIILQAVDKRMCRNVALKVIRPEKQVDEHDRLRFLEEAQITGQLQHPNIVPVHELGIDDNNQIYYTMKFVKGLELREILNEIRHGRQKTIDAYPLSDLLTVFLKVCDAVAFAHSKGVVHRDLKPGNIMIGEYGEVMVMDWGLAKLLDRQGSPNAAAAQASLQIETAEGYILGTPNYMAPEQAQGIFNEIDTRSDIFSLGAILYHILTLRMPVEGTAEECIQRIINSDIVPPTELNPSGKRRSLNGQALPKDPEPTILYHCPNQRIPDSLSAVAMKAMATDKAIRYQSVKELQEDIEAYRNGFLTSAENASVFKHLTSLIRRHKVETAVALAAFAALVIITAGFMIKIIASQKQAVSLMERAVANEQLAKANEKRALINERKAKENAEIARRNETLAKKNEEIARENERRMRESQKLAAASEQKAQQSQKLAAASEHRAKVTEQKMAENQSILKTSAQVLYEQAREFASRNQLDQALEQIDAALKALPRQPDYIALQACILQTMLRVNEARIQFDNLLRLKPSDNAAKENRDVCVAALKLSKDREILTGAALKLLCESMLKQGRRGEAELMRQYWNGQKNALCQKWKPELAKLGITPARLDVDVDGDGLALNLRQTTFQKFSRLARFPISRLMLSHTEMDELAGLKETPIQNLCLNGEEITDISNLKGLADLRTLDLSDTHITNLEPLQGIPLQHLNLSRSYIQNLSPLEGMPLVSLNLASTTVRHLNPLAGMPLKHLDLSHCTELLDLDPLIQCKDLETLIMPYKYAIYQNSLLSINRKLAITYSDHR